MQRKKRYIPFENFGISQDIDYLVENTSILIASGMAVTEALDSILFDIKSKRVRRVVEEIKDDIESGSPLWRAFENSGLFSRHTVSLIRIGEESGKLSDNLKVVSLQQSKERMFKSKVRSAMMYPVFVLSITLFVGIGIAWFILPKLATVFDQLKLELPFITEWLIYGGTFLEKYGTIAVPVTIFVLATLVYLVFFFEKTKFIGQSILFSIPGTKKLIQEIELSRFGYLLGILLQSGIPIVNAVDSLQRSTFFPQYRKFYKFLGDGIEEGNSFQKIFSNYKRLNRLIPSPVQKIIIVGERSGNLSKSLISVSETFEEKAEVTTKNISIILEPILLVIVWLGVVAVALAVILPIYSLIGGLNSGPEIPAQNNTRDSGSSENVTQDSTLEVEVQNQNTEVIQEIETGILKILEIETGYLNIREEPTIDSKIISRVLPGEEHEYTDMVDNWYEIMLPNGEFGWVSGEYVEII